MRSLPVEDRGRLWASAVTGASAGIAAGLGVKRVVQDRNVQEMERTLFVTPHIGPAAFSPSMVYDLPEAARRYLLHAIAPGTPLAAAVRLHMTGSMPPSADRQPLKLTADETLAPGRGFVWTARATMHGFPVRVCDHYFNGEGSVQVTSLGLLPIPMPVGADVTRSAHGRLLVEAVWCPTALVGPHVVWEMAGLDGARFTLAVDGHETAVTIYVAPNGALREVCLQRWGDVGVDSWQPLPYGFEVQEEKTFDGVTIPTRLYGGWHYGTERFDPSTAARFNVRSVEFARPSATGSTT